jgi:PAS domain S-box-containing protein
MNLLEGSEYIGLNGFWKGSGMNGTDDLSAESIYRKKHTVLLVDDNIANLDVMVSCLSDVGFQVLVARNGETCLELVERTIPDIILLDTMLPDMDGFEVCRRLKANEKTRMIMVIFVSSLDETQEKTRGFSLGAVDFITKPFQKEEVLARVNAHLRLQDLALGLLQNVHQQTEAQTAANCKLRQEITERKQIEEALLESEARYRAAIENSNDGIAIVEEGHYVFVNQKLLDILDYDQREELVGKHLSVILHPDDKERVARYNHLREKGRPAPSRYEAKGITRDGRTVYFDISATKITYRDRTAVLAFLRDITQRKQLEKQLQQAQKMEAIGTLAGGIAHDFNNILSAILGHAELAIVHRHNPATTHNHLDQVLSAAKRAAQLVQQILTFSRQKDLERKPLEISPLISEMIRMLRASLPSTIDIQYNIEDQSGMIMADATQIHQVLMNLCTNAAHAMRDRGGLLRIGLDKVTTKGRGETPLKPGNYMRMSVEDNGHGMDRTTMDRIFDPYFSTKKPDEGTGLGLAVVHGIIAGYGGRIEVESEPDKGTVFHVFLPRIEQSQKVEEPPLSLDKVPVGHERILFVDDEKLIVSIYDDLLKELGYQVVSTTNSEEALALFEKDVFGFNLVITDLIMPNLNGEELSKRLIGLRPDIPIIMCTGYSNQLSKEETQSLGISKYLKKPLVIDQLAHAVREVLDRR